MIKYKEPDLHYILYLIMGFGFLFNNTSLVAQDYPFKRYRVSDGLSQSQGSIIYNDSRGYIWIGTRNGLSRFVGIDFVNYHHKDGLPSNLIIAVLEDQAGQLWVVTNEGLSRYTGFGFIFYPPGDGLTKRKTFKDPVVTGTAGKIFLILDHDLILFDKGSYTNLSVKGNPLDSLDINDIEYAKDSGMLLLTDSEGALWSMKEDILNKISDGTFRAVTYKNDKMFVFAGDSISEFINGKVTPFNLYCKQGRKEVIFLRSQAANKLRYFDGYQLHEFTLPFRPIDVTLDRQGSLWFPSENDIYRLQSTAFATLGKGINNPEDVWTLCMDRNGHLWLGTIGGDLYEYDGLKYTKRNEYKKLFTYSKYKAFLKGSRTLSNGETWFSLSEGILIWDETSFRRFKGLPENVQVCFIYEDPDNHKVMIGTHKGLFIDDHGETTCYSRFTDDDLGVIEGITKDKSGIYWFSGHKGVVRFDGPDIFRVQDKILPQSWTYNIETDSLGGIWVSSDEGLFCKKYSDAHFSPGLPPDLNRPAGTLKILNKSTLLVGRGGDICLIDLAGYYGNKKDYYRIYDSSDGYMGDECLDNGIIKGAAGAFWILTSNNIIKFYPARLHKNELPPAINFTGIFYENDSLVWQSCCNNDFYSGIPSNIKFSRHHNNIKITYSGISTANPENVKYISWLEGMDKSWSLPSDKREVIYENLSPGKYCFHLKGINADRVQNSNSSDLAFTISPAFYETIAFRSFSLLFLIFTTIYFTSHYLKKIQSHKEEKQRISSELLRLQVNSVIKEFDPHFTFNAMTSLGALILMGKRAEAYSYLTKLSSMLRTAMQDESIVIKPLRDELQFVTNYLELQKLRFGERFNYILQVDEDIDLGMTIPKMSIQTFVENAVKHGLEPKKECGWVEINLSHQDGASIIIIKDNGIGRQASSSRKSNGFGFGIKTVKRIFEIMNQENRSKATIKIKDLADNGIVKGTEVNIVIPDTFSFDNRIALTDKIAETVSF